MSLHLDNLSEQISQLPVLPRLLQNLMEQLADHSIGLNKIAKMVASDPAMGSRVLKMANSAAYRGTKEITSIENASMRLGAQTLSNVIVASYLVNAFPKISKEERENFWTKTYCISTFVRDIAPKVGLNASSAFTCAMLHNIGELVIMILTDEYQKDEISSLIAQGETKIAAQKQILNADYRQVGVLLARMWSFPDLFICCIAQHLTPLIHKPVSKEACVISLAIEVSNLIQTTNTELNEQLAIEPTEQLVADLLEYRLSESLLEELNLNFDDLVSVITNSLVNKAEEMLVLFS